MRNVVKMLGLIGLALLGASCVSYSGVAKAADGTLYLSGATNYFVFSEPWIKHCTVDGLILNCEELSEPAKTQGANAATATTAQPTASPAPSDAPPTPEPAAPTKPTKQK